MLGARIATAVVLIGALLGALLLLPRPAWTAVVAALLALAAHEWARLCHLKWPARWGFVVLTAAGFAALAFSPAAHQGAFAVATFFWVLLVPVWLWRGVASSGRSLLVLAGWIVLVPAGLAMATLRPLELLLVLAVVWIADTGAYFAGRKFGRHKLAPSISPGKSWEGAAGGLLGVLAYAIICGTRIEGISWVPYLAATVLLGVISVVGDLFESAAKRQAGVKDSGSILPGHGGVLDRIDSATAVLPIAALLLPYVRAA